MHYWAMWYNVQQSGRTLFSTQQSNADYRRLYSSDKVHVAIFASETWELERYAIP